MLVRDGAAGVEVYLTRRSARSSFVPDAYVFPGGAVEPQDREPDIRACLNAELPAPELAIAAVRELFEEAGILLAVDASGRPAALDDARRRNAREALLRGTPFVDIVREAGLMLDARNLHAYSNWITPLEEPKRFDTHFFAARLPAGQTPKDDAREVSDGRWFRPDDALRAADRGELTIIFPTRKHLERIGAAPDADAFLAHARARAYEPVLAVWLGGNEFGLPAGRDQW
jgi:8-oxo-dGTP pyrophosphatase MutT (NUDIX family)